MVPSPFREPWGWEKGPWGEPGQHPDSLMMANRHQAQRRHLLSIWGAGAGGVRAQNRATSSPPGCGHGSVEAGA